MLLVAQMHWNAYSTRRFGVLESTDCTKSTNLSQLMLLVAQMHWNAYYTRRFGGLEALIAPNPRICLSWCQKCIASKLDNFFYQVKDDYTCTCMYIQSSVTGKSVVPGCCWQLAWGSHMCLALSNSNEPFQHQILLYYQCKPVGVLTLLLHPIQLSAGIND